MDLGLVNRSAYSASVNPHFHEWIHFIGCIFNAQRSINARHITENALGSILINSMIVGYVFFTNSDLQLLFTSNLDHAKRLKERMDKDKVMEGDAELLTSRDPKVWTGLLKDSNGQLPKEVIRVCKSMAANMDDVRQGTVGEKFVNLLSAYNV